MAFNAIISMDENGTIALTKESSDEEIVVIPDSFFRVNDFFDEDTFISWERDVEALEEIIAEVLKRRGLDCGPLYAALYKTCVPGLPVHDPADYIVKIYEV